MLILLYPLRTLIMVNVIHNESTLFTVKHIKGQSLFTTGNFLKTIKYEDKVINTWEDF